MVLVALLKREELKTSLAYWRFLYSFTVRNTKAISHFLRLKSSWSRKRAFLPRLRSLEGFICESGGIYSLFSLLVPVFQLVEKMDLKSIKCGFESHLGHHCAASSATRGVKVEDDFLRLKKESKRRLNIR